MANATTNHETAPPSAQNGSTPAPNARGAPDDGLQSLISRLQILGYGAEQRLRTLGITSCTRQEGVSTVAANLAIEAGRLGARVLVVDANVIHPSLHHVFSVNSSPGLVDAIGEEMAWEVKQQLVQQTSDACVSLLPAGTVRGSASGFRLPLDRVIQLVQELASEFDLVVVDLPAASVPTHLVSLASKLDGVLLVVEAERTSGESAARGKSQLVDLGANLLGVVFNKRRSHWPPWLDRLGIVR